MTTSKSRRGSRRAKCRDWSGANATEAKARARAAAAARRAADTASLPEPYRGPAPGSVWRRIRVEDGAGTVLLDIELRVPFGPARCDQLAALIDGARADHLLTATEAGQRVAKAIGKRPSVRLLADWQREEAMPAEHIP